MTQQIINVGTAPNDGTGDPGRTAWTKANANFTELYAAGSGGTTVPPQGRLTLQTAMPVMTTTQSAKTTIYYTPYVGNRMPIYDGTNMVMTTFAELSVLTTDTTKNPAAVGASQVLDWFIWSDAGTLRISHGPAWTSDTVRSAGTALVMVNGILLNNASITNGPAAQRGTYVGTTRSNASSQLDWTLGSSASGGGKAFLNVWNMYNRVNVATQVNDTTSSETYNAATWKPFLNSANNAVDFILGLAEDAFLARSTCYCNTDGSLPVAIGIGYDVTNAASGITGSTGATSFTNATGEYATAPTPGKHTVTAIEIGSGSGPCIFYGTAHTTTTRSGLTFSFRM